MAVLAGAIICAGFICIVAQMAAGTIVWSEFDAGRAMEPILFLGILLCSTGFWTLVARSMVGGIILTGAAQLLLYMLLVVFVRAIDALAPGNPFATRISHTPDVHAALLHFVTAFALSYAALMLWLGRRRFVSSFPGPP